MTTMGTSKEMAKSTMLGGIWSMNRRSLMPNPAR